MNRKLLALNIVMVAIVAYAGVELRRAWKASKEREAAIAARKVKPRPAPDYQTIEVQPPVVATGYVDIAKKLLFDPSRNPDVPVEPPPTPPPPPPMPPLPVYHGMMNIDGPTALLSIGSTSPHAIRLGERIGQFTLVDVTTDGIAFEWNGQTVRKSTDQLSRAASGIQQAPPDERTAAPAPPEAPRKALEGPGESTNFGFKTCNVADGNAEGTVKDGYRKINMTTPFGQACRWEPVGR